MAARQLTEDIYDMTRTRVLKHKNVGNLLRYCQAYQELSIGISMSEFDEHFFSNSVVPNAEPGFLDTFVGYQ